MLCMSSKIIIKNECNFYVSLCSYQYLLFIIIHFKYSLWILSTYKNTYYVFQWKRIFTVRYVRQNNFTHFALVHQCFACTSWVVVPYHEAGEWSSVSDWVGNYQDKALWQEQKKGLDFDESNLFQIWPQHRADCTVEGCHKDRCRVFCGKEYEFERSCNHLKGGLGDNRPYESFFTWSLGFHWVCLIPAPSHHHNSFELAFSDIFCNVLQSLLANVATASSEQPS